MAGKEKDIRKYNTFIWKLDNLCHWWCCRSIVSPEFTVKEIDDTKWKLQLELNTYLDSNVCLERLDDSEGTKKVKIDFELSFLTSDGRVLHSIERENKTVHVEQQIEEAFPSWSELFFVRRSGTLPHYSLTVRCKIRKSVGEISEDVPSVAHTWFSFEKKSFCWDIRNFSSLELGNKQTYEIKSFGDGEKLMTLDCCLLSGMTCDEKIRISIVSNSEKIKCLNLQISILDTSKNTVKCFEVRDDYDDCDRIGFTLCFTKKDLLERKNVYLPNDVLSFLCECVFCFETVEIISDSDLINGSIVKSKENGGRHVDVENLFLEPRRILINDLKSLLNDNTLSDIELRTKTKTHPAHKCMLSSRSPVFHAMFSNEMREKSIESVDIEDLNDDTITRMLQYIYNADVGDLEWVSATELYEAADKYQIITLKDICSFYIKTNLCPSNACDALVLADIHQDKDLKSFVQDFILRHGKYIMNSEEWEQLMKNDINLAAETMHLLYKK